MIPKLFETGIGIVAMKESDNALRIGQNGSAGVIVTFRSSDVLGVSMILHITPFFSPSPIAFRRYTFPVATPNFAVGCVQQGSVERGRYLYRILTWL